LVLFIFINDEKEHTIVLDKNTRWLLYNCK